MKKPADTTRTLLAHAKLDAIDIASSFGHRLGSFGRMKSDLGSQRAEAKCRTCGASMNAIAFPKTRSISAYGMAQRETCAFRLELLASRGHQYRNGEYIPL